MKLKRLYTSKLRSLYTAFLHSIKLSGYKMVIKTDKFSLAVAQNNCAIKIVNVYVVYDLDPWLINPTNNFKFKNCLFGAMNIAKNSDKEKYVYSGSGITFNSSSSWSFDNDTARHVCNFWC